MSEVTEKAIEDEIVAKGKTAPRITPDMVDAWIKETTFTQDGLLTVCILTATNGYRFVGKSACASPENFDEDIGRKLAHDDARKQLWPHLGFQLCSELAGVRIIPAE